MDARTSDGETALHAAAQHGSPEVVLALAQSGAWVNAVNSKGITPLHWAAVNGQSAALEVCAFVDARTGITPSFANGPLYT